MKNDQMLINPVILKWARKTLGLSEDIAAIKLNIEKEELIAWENGEKVVPIRKLKTLSKVYKRASVLFLLDKEPSENIPAKFRKLIDLHTGQFTENTILAIRKAVRTQNIAKDVFGNNPNEFIGKLKKLSALTDYEFIGEKILELLEITAEDLTKSRTSFEQLNYWKQIIEAQGIYILELGFPTEEAKGFAIYDEVAPIIVLNTNDHPNPRIFTLIHELAHFIYQKDTISDESNILNFKSDDKTEVACNYIAGSVLVPLKTFNEKIEKLEIVVDNIDLSLEILRRVFNISGEVILRRLLINKNIDKFTFDKSFDVLKKRRKEKTKTRGGNFYIKYLKNNSRSFVENIIDAYKVNTITFGDALDYLSIKSETLVKLESRL